MTLLTQVWHKRGARWQFLLFQGSGTNPRHDPGTFSGHSPEQPSLDVRTTWRLECPFQPQPFCEPSTVIPLLLWVWRKAPNKRENSISLLGALSPWVCVFWEWAKLFTLLLCLVSNCVQWQLIGCFLKKIMKAFSTRRWATAWSRSWSFHGMDLPVFWLPLLGPHLLSHMLINHGRMIVKNLKMSPTNAISVSFFQQAS